MSQFIQNTSPAEMTSEQIIDLCRQLGEGFAKRASKHDREGSFPEENFQELKDNNLLGIMIPKDRGGMGADFVTYTRALEQIAKGDASTGLTFNMHNIAVGSLAELNVADIGGSRGKKMNDFIDWVYDQSITHKKLFASASSEPGIGAHLSKMKTVYDKTDEGFIINGVKNWVSMAGYADYYVVAAKYAKSETDVPAISYLVVEKENPNARVEFTWDVLGMRATSTNPVYFEDCFVPKESLFLGNEGMALYKVAREPHWLVGGYVGVYLGICSAAFEFLVNYLKNRNIPGTQTPLADDSRIQHKVGELYVKLEAARNTVHKAAKLVTEQPGTVEANTAIHQAKFLVSELGPELTSDAIRLCGGSTIAKFMPLERYYREARCGGLMPATSDECLLYLGKAAFGTDLSKPAETYW